MPGFPSPPAPGDTGPVADSVHRADCPASCSPATGEQRHLHPTSSPRGPSAAQVCTALSTPPHRQVAARTPTCWGATETQDRVGHRLLWECPAPKPCTSYKQIRGWLRPQGGPLRLTPVPKLCAQNSCYPGSEPPSDTERPGRAPVMLCPHTGGPSWRVPSQPGHPPSPPTTILSHSCLPFSLESAWEERGFKTGDTEPPAVRKQRGLGVGQACPAWTGPPHPGVQSSVPTHSRPHLNRLAPLLTLPRQLAGGSV